jgi:Ca2+-binding EF-hand superfamily protein
VMLEFMKTKLSYESQRQDSISKFASKTDKKGARDDKTGIRSQRMLGDVFKLVSMNDTQFMSIKNIQGLGARLNFYLTSEEASKIEVAIDTTGDGRIEEEDFVRFMEKPSQVYTNIAKRIAESSQKLKNWVARSQIDAQPAPGQSQRAAVVGQMWNEFKVIHESTLGTRFPDYLVASDLRSIMARKLNIRLSPEECRLLMMLIAPMGHGQVRAEDLRAFSDYKCRSLGELLAVLEREMLKPVMDVYKELQAAVKAKNLPDEKELEADLVGFEQEIVDTVQAVQVSSQEQIAAKGNDFSSSSIVTLSQIKEGLEGLLADQHQLEDHELLNLEEWGMVALLVGHCSLDEGSYGLKMDGFVRSVCQRISGPVRGSELVSVGVGAVAKKQVLAANEEGLDAVSRELQQMIREEAAAAAVPGSGKSYNFEAPFKLFDTDGNGIMSHTEFKAMLEKLRIIDNITAEQVPMLIHRFDRGNKGEITIDDFQTFAEKGRFGLADAKTIDHDDYVFEGSGLTSLIPPAAITKDADTDQVLWHLWRRCCTIEPLDPESVVTSLERACLEIETARDETGVGQRELWALLSELDLRVGLNVADFQRGVGGLLRRGHKGDMLVDCSSLCRATVRMGRAYVSLERDARAEGERIYHELVINLQEELRRLGEVTASAPTPSRSGSISKAPKDILRFEHVMYRLDDDGDGRLSVSEFQMALKRLRCSDSRQWQDRFVARLFEEVEPTSLDVMSIKEFSSMVRSGELGSRPPQVPVGRNKKFLLDDDDDDEDGGDGNIFAKAKTVGHNLLIRKCYEILSSVVPRSGSSQLHSEAVCGAVRRFFEHSDPEGRGVVTDDRFRTFCRRSGLQDKLTLAEIRLLIEKLRTRRGAIGGDRLGVSVDYERFCDLLSDIGGYDAGLNGRVGSGAHSNESRAESILIKLQDAAAASAAAGRAFPALCSLLDQRGTGWLLRDEFVHVAKMMGMVLSLEDIEMLTSLLPATGLDGEQSISHREILRLLEEYAPRSALSGDLLRQTPSHLGLGTPGPMTGSAARHHFDFEHTALRHGGALPQYASPRISTPMVYNYPGTVGPGGALATPGGGLLRTPFGAATPGTVGGAGGVAAVYNESVASVAERLRLAQSSRARTSRDWEGSGGSGGSLMRQCEAMDINGRGVLPVRSFQALADGLGVPLSAPELYALSQLFGRPGSHGEEAIEYLPLCAIVDGGRAALSTIGGHAIGAVTSALYPQTPSAGSQSIYMTDWTFRRLRELKGNGQDPRDMFEAIDLDRVGLINQRRFKEILERLDLLQSDRHIEAAIQDYTSLGDRLMVDYDNFCKQIERGSRTASTGGFGVSSSHDRDANPSGPSGLNASLRDFKLAHGSISTEPRRPPTHSAASRRYDSASRDDDLRWSMDSGSRNW